ncbi:PASTA domain-containing protein [Pseudonocardia alaniniphila]|uniref:PASTA domain-containing protein n=1 Tax=Pseudonocardia alaniniphila TaxID=75291 RepID=A0ABS9TTZ8_9PSEU|nr:PASTA domain-containing protein [Pseudonocardia alaniniphila]MCH6171818.1 PASTA domain-containing protein [Pseudonocardia alaniniphila]
MTAPWTPQHQQIDPQAEGSAVPAQGGRPPLLRRGAWPVVVAILTGLVVVGSVVVVAVNVDGAARRPADAVAAESVVPAAGRAPTAADVPVTVPDLSGKTGNAASEALGSAGVLNVTFARNDALMTQPVIGQSPAAGTRQRAGDPVHVTLQPAAPAAPPSESHRKLSSRDWLVIAKNPDAHVGERVIVHGRVTQFDAATGTTAFRASVDGVRQKQAYDYDTNTLLGGDAADLEDIVVDDEFTAEVTVMGSLTYKTQIGGSTTVPVLLVQTISRTS